MKLSERLRRTARLRREEIQERTTLNHPLETVSVELKIKGNPEHPRIAVVTDAQNKPGVPTNHLVAAGNYIADKRPEVIVCIGDWWDFPSLSVHEKPGHIELEGRRYRLDLDAGLKAMELFMEAAIGKTRSYEPQLIFVPGNHEDRVTRARRANPAQLDGLISLSDLRLKDYGWTVYPFLQPVVIGGVAFCHYFPSGIMGRPITTAAGILRKLHQSAFAGHQQGRDIAYGKRADGGDLTAIISGSFYQHDETYLSPFTNKHWRGMYFLHEVRDGRFDEMALGIDYLIRRWGPK